MERSDMRSLVRRIGNNHWLLLVQITALFFGAGYTRSYTNYPSWDYICVQVFFTYSLFAIAGTRKLILFTGGNLLAGNLPVRPHWKRWFWILHTPHILYSLWYAVWMTAVHHAPQCILISVLMLFLLLCAYLRLSMDDA